jgi:DNA-binding transcriptional LysR family regulator
MKLRIFSTAELSIRKTYQVEIGLVAESIALPEIEQQAWLQDMLVPIISPQRRGATPEPVTLQQLLAQPLPLIVREQGSGTRAALERALAALGTRSTQKMIELGSTEAIKRAVSADLGYAFVSAHTISQEEAAGFVTRLSVTDFSVQRSFSLVYLKGGRHSKAAQAFLTLIGK